MKRCPFSQRQILYLKSIFAVLVIIVGGVIWASGTPSVGLPDARLIPSMQLATDIYELDNNKDGLVTYPITGVGEVGYKIDEKNSIGYLVFRGTHKFAIDEVVSNISLWTMFLAIVLIGAGFYSRQEDNPLFLIGAVIFVLIVVFCHRGKYTTGYERTSALLIENLKRRENVEHVFELFKGKVRTIYFSGHSKGGAEATLTYDKYEKDCRELKMQCHLVTMGSPSSLRQENKYPQSYNIMFKSDSAQILNLNFPAAETIKFNRLEVWYFPGVLIFAMLLLRYLIHLGRIFKDFLLVRYGNMWRRPLELISFVGLVIFIPVYLTIWHLVFTHPASHYLRFALKYQQ